MKFQRSDGYPENLNEMFPNKESLYQNNWAGYKKTRHLMVDCDIYESGLDQPSSKAFTKINLGSETFNHIDASFLDLITNKDSD